MTSPNILLDVNGIEVIYNHVILVLKGVSLQVPEGRIVALMGGNGAGKTTTLRAVSNLLQSERGAVTKGSIALRGERIESLSTAEMVNRGVIIQMLAVESVRRAQERFGKGKVMTGEQVRWGMENLALDQKKLDAMGFGGVMRPLSTSCADHMGSTWARVHTWDGAKWNFSSDWYQADEQILKPMVKAGADKYLADKKMTRRDPADCNS